MSCLQQASCYHQEKQLPDALVFVLHRSRLPQSSPEPWTEKLLGRTGVCPLLCIAVTALRERGIVFACLSCHETPIESIFTEVLNSWDPEGGNTL